jgi:hypothetical protein
MRNASRELDRFAANSNRVGSQLRSNFANVGFQIQDMAVQIGSGTSALRALTQQLPQIAAGFGPSGSRLALRSRWRER